MPATDAAVAQAIFSAPATSGSPDVFQDANDWWGGDMGSSNTVSGEEDLSEDEQAKIQEDIAANLRLGQEASMSKSEIAAKAMQESQNAPFTVQPSPFQQIPSWDASSFG